MENPFPGDYQVNWTNWRWCCGLPVKISIKISKLRHLSARTLLGCDTNVIENLKAEKFKNNGLLCNCLANWSTVHRYFADNYNCAWWALIHLKRINLTGHKRTDVQQWLLTSRRRGTIPRRTGAPYHAPPAPAPPYWAYQQLHAPTAATKSFKKRQIWAR